MLLVLRPLFPGMFRCPFNVTEFQSHSYWRWPFWPTLLRLLFLLSVFKHIGSLMYYFTHSAFIFSCAHPPSLPLYHVIKGTDDCKCGCADIFSTQWFQFPWKMTRSEVGGSYGGPVLSILGNLQQFSIWMYNLHSCQQCAGVLFISYTQWHFLFIFLLIAILINMKWHPIVILSWIFLIINDAEHFFMSLLTICMSLFEKYLPISKKLVFGCLVFIYILDINPLSDVWFSNIFSHSVCCISVLFFTLLNRTF